jgi:VanZ family protein
MALIFVLSSQSQPLPALTERVWDKALHLTGYAVLGVLLCRALRAEGLMPSTAFVAAVLLVSAYGASDEWHQSFVPLRDADVRDWVADSIGAAIGAWVHIAWAPISGYTSRAR